jgi:hypothetical protein
LHRPSSRPSRKVKNNQARFAPCTKSIQLLPAGGGTGRHELVYDSREYSVPKAPNFVRLAMGTPQSGVSAHRDRSAFNYRGPNTYLE